MHSGQQSKQPADWGLATWQKHGGKRNGGSSWVYTHAGDHWLMYVRTQRIFFVFVCFILRCLLIRIVVAISSSADLSHFSFPFFYSCTKTAGVDDDTGTGRWRKPLGAKTKKGEHFWPENF